MNNETGKELVRIELNLEKWNIFTTKEHRGERILSRIDEEGNIQRIKIQPFVSGNKEYNLLATREGKTLTAFFKKWEKAGRSFDKPVFFNFSEIAEILNIDYGGRGKKHIKEACLGLRGVQLVCENIYKDPATGDTIKVTEPMTILSHLKIFERSKRKENDPYFAFSEFQFHPYILYAFQNKNFKPLRLDMIRQIRGDISLILYRFLDLVLADKPQYNRDVEKLAKELGFGAKRLDNLVNQIRKACEELEGKDITTGKIVYCQVEKTVDGKRWKLVVRKGKQTETPTEEIKELATVAEREEETLVKLFLKEFGHNREPVAKELDQATELISRLGLKKAEHVVKYGIREARRKYHESPEWLGAILLYEGEALAELERAQAAKKHAAEQKAKERAARESRKQLTTVCLEYTGTAQDVRVAGSFNNWQPEPLGCFNNRWTLFLDLPAGEYQYKLVVDGNWICDPGNPERARDDKGNENSVLKLRNEKVFIERL